MLLCSGLSPLRALAHLIITTPRRRVYFTDEDTLERLSDLLKAA